MYEITIQIISRKFVHYSIKDFANFYESTNPLFMAYNGDRSTYYYERETSLKILKKLLMYWDNSNVLYLG